MMTSSELEIEMLRQLTAQFYLHDFQVDGFVVEYKFHPIRRWRFDFAWPDLHVALEVEGGTWQKGRHTSGVGFEKDCEKYNEAACLGWTVLRVTANMVADGTALEFVRRALASH
jgi:very-short-patch-repair endonuclease